MLVLGYPFEMSHCCLYHLSPASPPQSAASQSQSIPAISQAPQSGAMGYMGSQSVSMGYQPYGMQVSTPCPMGPFLGAGGDEVRVGSSLWSLPGPMLPAAGKGGRPGGGCGSPPLPCGRCASPSPSDEPPRSHRASCLPCPARTRR